MPEIYDPLGCNGLHLRRLPMKPFKCTSSKSFVRLAGPVSLFSVLRKDPRRRDDDTIAKSGDKSASDAGGCDNQFDTRYDVRSDALLDGLTSSAE